MPRSVFQSFSDLIVTAGGRIGSPRWMVRMDTARRQADYSGFSVKKGQLDEVIAAAGRMRLRFPSRELRERYMRRIQVLQDDGVQIFLRRSDITERRVHIPDAYQQRPQRRAKPAALPQRKGRSA